MTDRPVGAKSLLVFLFFVVIYANATLWGVMYPMSTQRLKEGSSLVVRGEVLTLQSHWDNERSVIFTRAKLFVFEELIGDAGQRVIDVEYPGGEVGEMGMGISDHPKLSIGEHVLLFLQPTASYNNKFSDCFKVVGAAQGKYSIDEDGIARKGGFSVVDLDSEKPGIKQRNSVRSMDTVIDLALPLDALVEKITGKKSGKKGPYRQPVNVTGTSLQNTPGLSKPGYNIHGKWGKYNVGLQINTSGGPSYGLGAVMAGMTEWNNVYTSGFKWLYAGATTSKSTSRNNRNIVYFASLGGCSLGYSNWWYSGGKIIETDVKLDTNGCSGFWWNFPRLKAVVLHELGHSLGMDHVSNTAIMKLPASDSRLNLFMDDIMAVTKLYPAANVQPDFNGDGKSDFLLRHQSVRDIRMWLMNGPTITTNQQIGSFDSSWRIMTLNDFDGDTKADMLLRHGSVRDMRMWLLDGTTIAANTTVGNLDNTWQIVALADFDGNNTADILLYHGYTKDLRLWLMNGTTISQNQLLGTLDNGWQVKALADFDGNGTDDILFHHGNSRELRMWLMNGATITQNQVIASIDSNWQVIAPCDFNGDGKSDILLHHSTVGDIRIWLMDGVTRTQNTLIGSIDLSWLIRSTSDFDGDGKSDILLHHSAGGYIRMWLMNGTTRSQNQLLGTIDTNWKIRGTGDYNGDGNADILLHYTAGRDVRMWLMNGTTITQSSLVGSIGTGWLIH